jgi:hypothetical protein
MIPIDDRHFGYKNKFQKKHCLLFLLLDTVLYLCIAGGQRADRKETARSVGGRRGRERERERERARAYAYEDEEAEKEGRNGYGFLAIGFTTRARVFRRRRVEQ